MATVEQFNELAASNKTIIETLASMNSTLQTVAGLKTAVDTLTSEVQEVRTQVQEHKEVTASGLAAVNKRVDDVQAAISGSGSSQLLVLKAPLKVVLPRAVQRLDQLYDEAAQMEGTVIVGKLASAPADRYSENLVRDVVQQLSGSSVSYVPRGDKGVFAINFKAVAKNTPGVRARSFLLRLPTVHASRIMWAQPDRPKELRDHDSRARRFGRHLKSKIVAPSAAASDKSPIFFTVVKGFLVINESVIGPINLIPDEEHWPELAELVCTLIRNPRRPQLTHSKSFLSQMTRPIAEFLYESYVAIPEDFPDPCSENADESDLLDLDYDPDQVDPVVTPPVFEANIDWLAPLNRPTSKGSSK
jgi:hypothetical protein